ncbi:MAG: ABC transporter substrate-binding protein [Alphaproteobacteria bacterium]|nr:ABC transporter substrate-binding protein [Alphaproteobacteria bacterium]
MPTLARRLAAALVALAALATAAAAEPVKIRIGWSSMPAHMIPALYRAQGALRHMGRTYTVEPVNFQASTPQITAMAAKQIDIAAFSPTALVLGVTNARLDIKVVADTLQDGKAGHYSQTFYVRTDSGIDSVPDLKGKRVGTNAVGSASDTTLRAMLRKHNLDPRRDLQIIEVSFANQLPMIEDGKIDATTIPMPMAHELVKSGKYKPLFSAVDVIGSTQFTFLAARAEFLEQNRAAVMDFFEDTVRAMRWFYDPKNREEGLKIVAEVSKRPVGSLYHLFTSMDYFRDPYLIPDVAGIQRAIDVTHELGFLQRRIDVAPAYVDLSFVEEARRRIQANP